MSAIYDADGVGAGVELARDADPARRRPVLEGLLGIHEEVHEDLVDLIAIGRDRREARFQSECDLDTAGPEPIPQDPAPP